MIHRIRITGPDGCPMGRDGLSGRSDRTRQASQPKSSLVFKKPSLPHTRHHLRPPLMLPSDVDLPAKTVRR